MIGQIICSALFQVLKFLLIWPVLDDLSQKAWGDQKSTSAVLSTFWCCRLFVCRRTIVCESLIRATIVELLMAKSIFFDIHLELPNNCPYCYYQVFFFFFLWLRLGPYWGRKWGCSPRAEKDVSLLLPLLGSDQQLRRGYTQCNIYIIRSQIFKKIAFIS